jgi:hypothetical protein
VNRRENQILVANALDVGQPTGREGPDVNFEEGVGDRILEHVFAGSVCGLGQEMQVLLRNWGDFDVPGRGGAGCWGSQAEA